VLTFAVGLLAAHYRRESGQLRGRNAQLSAENDRWREDFSAQAGELSALRLVVSGHSRVIDVSQLGRAVIVSRAEVP
jgi:hypothetical protein